MVRSITDNKIDGDGVPALAPSDLELYRSMLTIRGFEDAIQKLFLDGVVYGTTHLCSGQEAGPVGVATCLQAEDRVACTYRGHGVALAVGVPLQTLMDEMLGRATGVCGGRAGSMNIVDLKHRLLGCSGIVGGSMAAATGAALAFRCLGTSSVSVAFFGDGTSNHGYFHECLNFAQVRRLPVLFFCENNRYMEYTPIESVTAGKILDRPRALGIRCQQIDGNDVWAVRDATARALEHVRAGEGPAFIESLTYRLVGHSRSDPGAYRKPGELDEWTPKEPLRVTRRVLEAGGVGAEKLDEVEQSVRDELQQTVERSLSAPWPTPETSPGEFAAGLTAW
jgi:acetoin:2,6-dichlorophenolindophenol oxidoreductase subunit alpha